MVRVQSISPRTQFNNFSRDTVPLTLPFAVQVSSIAATGIFDPFTLRYASWVFSLFKIPGGTNTKV